MERQSLLVDLYELTMSQCYFEARRGYAATFDLFVRELPPNRSFLVAAGLADCLEHVRSLEFGREDIAYLRSLRLFSEPFLEYLRKLRFTGDIWAMPEGTVFFENEPLIRVTADIIQAQLLESYLLNTVNVQTMIASKAARVVIAAGGRSVYDFALRRTQGADAAMKAARSSFIAGCAGTSNVLAGERYGIPVAGTMAHSFVMSFGSEHEAFETYCRVYPDKSVLLVDTYDTPGGVRRAVKAGLELRAKGHELAGIRLDSGDLLKLSKSARRMLDAAGLRNVRIMASGNLDEYGISRLVAAGAPIDTFGVGTRMGASADAPSLDCIYKLSEVVDARGKFFPAMKLSRGKATYPGRKQVFRVTGKDGRLRRDILGLEDEKIEGTPLLQKVVDGGRISRVPGAARIRAYAREALDALPRDLKDIRGKRRFCPAISPGLGKLVRKLRRRFA